jgi:hypothetical protein
VSTLTDRAPTLRPARRSTARRSKQVRVRRTSSRGTTRGWQLLQCGW